jgi:hypothetical protein
VYLIVLNIIIQDVICLSEPVDKAKGLTVAESFGISQVSN